MVEVVRVRVEGGGWRRRGWWEAMTMARVVKAEGVEDGDGLFGDSGVSMSTSPVLAAISHKP